MPITQKEFEAAYQKANQKDAAAQYIVGKYYLEQKNVSYAKHWFTQSAEQGNSDAQLGLAELLLKESGDDALLKAVALLTKAAYKQEAAKKHLMIGGSIHSQLLKMATQQPQNQFQFYSGSQSSMAEANYLLARIHINPLLDANGIAEAIKYYEQAFKLGYVQAGKDLGDLYYEGKVIPQSYPDAFRIFKGINDRNPYDVHTSYFLGCLHEKYSAVKNIDKAIECYIRSISNRGLGTIELTRLYYDKYSNEKQEGQKAQYKFQVVHYARSSDTDKNSQNYLGIISYNDKQYLEAAVWFAKADAQGLSAGTYNLALVYKDDKCGKDKTKLSLDLMRKAAEKGHSSAQYELADYSKSGKNGLQSDLLQAFLWMQKAADQNHTNAKTELGDDKNALYLYKRLYDATNRDENKFKALVRLQTRLCYFFSNPEHLIKAFDRTQGPIKGEAIYQRYEFLGDSALGFVIANYLEAQAPKDTPTTKIHEMHAQMVANKTILPLIAKELNLNECLTLDMSEKDHSITDQMLADAAEALIGAIAKDTNHEVLTKIILTLWEEHLKKEMLICLVTEKITVEPVNITGFESRPLLSMEALLKGTEQAPNTQAIMTTLAATNASSSEVMLPAQGLFTELARSKTPLADLKETVTETPNVIPLEYK